MIAVICDLEAGTFVHTLGDAHIYANHVDQARLQMSRTPGALPQLRIHSRPKDIDGFKFEDFEIVDYHAQAHIAAPIAV
jgi:thymidylate synthase